MDKSIYKYLLVTFIVCNSICIFDKFINNNNNIYRHDLSNNPSRKM